MTKKQTGSQGDAFSPAVEEPTTTAIVASGSSALAQPSEHRSWLDPSDESQQEDRTIPYFRLIQHTSEEAKNRTANVGDIVTSTGINLGQWMVVVPLWFKRQASRFNDDRTLDCQSLDGVEGSTYGLCAECEFNYRKWGKDPLNPRKNVPPSCSEVRCFPSMVLASEKVEDGASVGIVGVQFVKSSATVGKQLITQHDLTGLPFYAFRWKVASKEKMFPKGSARVFYAEMHGRNPDNMMLQCQEICRSWSGAVVEMGSSEFPEEEGNQKAVDDGEAPF